MEQHKLFSRFLEALNLYSKVYKQFEDLQKDVSCDFVPEYGDQKTGLIGESFVYEYLRRKNKTNLNFGGASEKCWDIQYTENNAPQKIKVQVKTVSKYSKTRRISPIHKGWDYLYLVSLDKNFMPENIWILKADNFNFLFKNKNEIKGLKMPVDNAGRQKHKLFKNAEDITAEFKNIFLAGGEKWHTFQ